MSINKKISEFTELTTPANDDLMPIVDISDLTHATSGTTKKIKISTIATFFYNAFLTALQLLKWNADKLQDIDISETAPTDNQVLTYNEDDEEWQPAPAGTASPLTTKGDLYTFDTDNERLPVGTDDYVLTADSSTPTGLAWKEAAAGAGSNSILPLETLSGTINGTNAVFTLSVTPVANTEQIFLDGILQRRGATNDYTISGATVTFNTAPPIETTQLQGTCLISLTVSGNADTLDGFNASTTPTANTIPVLGTDGKLTTPLLKVTTGAAEGAFLTSNANGDATWENVAWTDWTPTLTGWSSNPTNTIYRYKKIGKTVMLAIRQTTPGTSNNTVKTISLPFTAATITNMLWDGAGRVSNNGSILIAGIANIISGSTTVDFYTDTNGGVWTASGNARIAVAYITYEAA